MANGGTRVAMTASVKDELSRLPVTKTCCRRAEISALLRFAGGLHIVGGRVVVEAELDTGSTARRLRRDIAEVYGHASEVQVLAGSGLRKGSRYIVRVVKDGEGLARQTGLLDQRGRPVRGLPPQVVSGGVCDAEAAWRGAFLAHGSLTEPGRSSSLEITCPGPEAALALVGAARRMGIQAKAREVRGVDRVVVRDGDAIGALLTRLGAHESVLAWEERRMRREVRATANRLANFDDANLRRSARAAVAAGARVAAGAGDPRRRPAGPPGRGRPAAAGAQAGVAGGARPARRPADDQGRGGRADPPAARAGRQAGRRPRRPRHRGQRHPRDARALTLRGAPAPGSAAGVWSVGGGAGGGFAEDGVQGVGGGGAVGGRVGGAGRVVLGRAAGDGGLLGRRADHVVPVGVPQPVEHGPLVVGQRGGVRGSPPGSPSSLPVSIALSGTGVGSTMPAAYPVPPRATPAAAPDTARHPGRVGPAHPDH